jgi:hypothetical protein
VAAPSRPVPATTPAALAALAAALLLLTRRLVGSALGRGVWTPVRGGQSGPRPDHQQSGLDKDQILATVRKWPRSPASCR